MQDHSSEPHINFICSKIFKGYRIHFVGKKIYYRDPTETFQDFIEYLAFETLGENWLNKQKSTPHILFQYAKDYHIRKKNSSLIDVRNESDGTISAISTGPNLFWLTFCYDLFILLHKQILPNNLIQRLKDQQHFQGARYELAIAAVFLRAGFDIRWIDKDTVEHKSCEFEATHRYTDSRVEVEVKSKKRTSQSLKQGIPNLLRDALKKKSASDTPLIICIDANLPFSAGSPLDKPLFNEAKRAIGILPNDKDDFTLLIITNFPFHHDGFDSVASPPENVMILPFNRALLDERITDDIQNSLNRYSIIPQEF